MKKLIYTTVIFLGLIANAQLPNYEQNFEKESLRLDFFLSGTHQSEQVILHQMKKEPFYAAASSHQLIYPAFGNYRIEIKDATTEELLFSKGFNPLFEEWQHTAEAKKITRTFENALQLPFPKKDIVIEISKRAKKGQFEKIYSQEISPNNYNILKESIVKYPVQQIVGNLPSEKAIDLAIIAEGYTADEMDKFVSDARRMMDYTFTIPPFDQYKNQFNVYAILSPSIDSGTDIPGEGIYKNTAVDSRFYTFDEPRYLTVPSIYKIADIAANVPYDHVYVLVNTPRYGGGGFYNVLNIATSDHALSDKVFVHEFGHGFAGLADEYYTSSVPAEEMIYSLDIEPWEPNITTLINFDAKWKSKVKKGTPIPTPRTKKYKDEVGVFEGGGYSDKGIYSPVQDCRMKSNEPKGFCPVCSSAIQGIIEFYTK